MLSAQQARSGIPTGRQSVLPTTRGVPWWAAVLIAGVPTAVGAIIDAVTTDELGIAYRVLFFLGCVAAVLTVRRRALFTAVTQPPLIAFFVALITLSALKSDSGSGLRNVIFNVMLPIAKTFPLMAWTFVAVGVLAAGRWYLTREVAAKPARTRPARTRSERTRPERPKTERTRSERARPERAPSDRAGSARTQTPRTTTRRADAPPRSRRDTPPRTVADAPSRTRAQPTPRQFSPRADGYGRRPRDTPPRDVPVTGDRFERYRGADPLAPPIPRARYRGVNP